MKLKLPPITRNFYFIFTACFVIWMFLFDVNDVLNQVKLAIKLHGMEKEKKFYEEKIKQVQKEKKELNDNSNLLEKFAREKYLMKKKEEEIFVIVPPKD